MDKNTVIMAISLVIAIGVVYLVSLSTTSTPTSTTTTISPTTVPTINATILQTRDSSVQNDFNLSIAISNTSSNLSSMVISSQLFYNGSTDYPVNETIVKKLTFLGCGTTALLDKPLVYAGYYTVHNISNATPLNIYKPLVFLCPVALLVSNVTFEPKSYNATYYIEDGRTYGISNSSNVMQKISINNITGYWIRGPCTSIMAAAANSSETAAQSVQSGCTFVPFAPGAYTVLVTDFMKQEVLAYFRVK